ncbi:MAG: hypothetical protein ACYDCG_08880 [Candidatus Acidiferrales bacterium]
MKTGRWLTWIGSVILFLTGIGHGSKFAQLQGMIQASSIKPPLDGIARACWLVFSGEMAAIAVIATVASGMERGGRIVLICAATMILDGALLFRFLGPFIGVYVTAAVAILFLAGGWMQAKAAA